MLYVLASPVGDYFASGSGTLKLLIEERARTTEQLGSTKTGGNYAASLVPQAEGIENGCDQVVFLDAVDHGRVAVVCVVEGVVPHLEPHLVEQHDPELGG